VYFITSLVHAITMPIQTIYSWIMRYTPGLKNLPSISPAMRLALTTFLFLVLIYIAGVLSYSFSRTAATRELWEFIVLFLLVIAIPIIVYYLVKAWMIKEQSRYPDIDRVWEAGLAECARHGFAVSDVPIFIVLGGRDQRQSANIMQASQQALTVTMPSQEDADIALFANSQALFLFVNGCSCLSRLSTAPVGPLASGASGAAVVGPAMAGGQPSGTIDASMFGQTPFGGTPADRAPASAAMGQTLTEGAFAPAPQPGAQQPAAYQPAAAGVGGTMLLPEGQAFDNYLASQGGSASQAEVQRVPQLSSQDIFEREQKLRHVCGLLNKARQPLCPINGLITLLPFDLVENASAQVQTAAQKDLAVLRAELLVRCPNTIVITQMDREEGFQELVKRVGEERAREFRFGKGSEVWNAPDGARLEATAAHAVGSFEDWIYMLFQEENALKHRYNSRLFMLLCRVRGKFAENLRAVLARGFGFDPLTESHLAYEQFLFSGCYFAAAGADPSRQAFTKSIFNKCLEQEGELEWVPEARARDQQQQFAANLLALVGMLSVISIICMLAWHFGLLSVLKRDA
jgi:hypothetical protein